MPDPLTRGTRAIGAVGLAAVVSIVAFCHGFTPIGDENDVWWHLKTGRVISQAGGWPPPHDVFAYTSSHLEWHNHEWLAEWAMYAAYAAFEDRALGGLRAVIFFKALLLAATFLTVLYLCARRAGDLTVAAVITLVAITAAKFSVKARPPIFSYGLMALFLVLLYGLYQHHERAWSRRLRLCALVALIAVWANLHGGFAIGLVLIALFAAGCVWDGALAWIRAGRAAPLSNAGEIRLAAALALCGAACFIATLLNPYGVKLYGMYARVMSDADLVRSISELQPPNLLYTHGFQALILALILAGSLAGRRLPTAADYLVVGFFLFQAARHVRHVPLFAIAAAPVIAWQARGIYDALPPEWKRWWRPVMASTAVILAAWLLWVPDGLWSGNDGRQLSLFDRNARLWRNEAYQPEGYPEEICDYLLTRDLPGRLFNEVNFAGYLIWRLSPDRYQVFTDSRYDIFGGQFQRQAWQIENAEVTPSGQATWKELLDHWDINLVIIDMYKPLNEALARSGEWRMEFTDKRRYFRLWVRNELRPVRPLTATQKPA